MYSTNSTNSIKQCRHCMDSNFLCTMQSRRREKACTPSIGFITSYTDISRNRIEMRTRTGSGNSGIKQLCAFLILFFTSLPQRSELYDYVQYHLFQSEKCPTAQNMVKIANSPLIRQYSQIEHEVMHYLLSFYLKNVMEK